MITLPQVDDKVKGKEQCCRLIDPLGTVLSKESNSPNLSKGNLNKNEEPKCIGAMGLLVLVPC